MSLALMSGCATEAGSKDLDAAKAESAEAKATAEKALHAAEEAKADAAAAKGMAQDAMSAAQEAKDEARAASEKADRMFKQSMRK
jgi:hypothetical protein